MARPISDKVNAVRIELQRRIQAQQRGGERFLSARAVAATFGVSYQTAHRLLTELRDAGFIERRDRSGTYLPGELVAEAAYSRLLLLFSERARRPQSFGARLLSELGTRLRAAGFPWEIRWAEGTSLSETPADAFPLFWEAPAQLTDCRRCGRRALLLNVSIGDADAGKIDSIAIDDFAGGAFAADLLRERRPKKAARFAVVTGPANDVRSDARRNGFLSRAPGATVIPSGGWFQEAGYDSAALALRSGPEGIFCANDRLAEGVLRYASRFGVPRPPLVGFDNAPIAAALDLTTIALPWEELADAAVTLLRRRFAGDASPAAPRIIAPTPLVRRL